LVTTHPPYAWWIFQSVQDESPLPHRSLPSDDQGLADSEHRDQPEGGKQAVLASLRIRCMPGVQESCPSECTSHVLPQVPSVTIKAVKGADVSEVKTDEFFKGKTVFVRGPCMSFGRGRRLCLNRMSNVVSRRSAFRQLSRQPAARSSCHSSSSQPPPSEVRGKTHLVVMNEHTRVGHTVRTDDPFGDTVC
jgi:hypothetical protein